MKLIQGDCIEVMKTLDANSVDCIITDPPYDFTPSEIKVFHSEFLRLAKCVIVFSPPENQWVHGADQILFWVKPVSTKNTSKSYSRFVEMIFVYGRNEWNSKRHWSQYPNVFHDLVDGKEHPFQKPDSLITRLALNHTKPGDLILDPFMGSGTVGMACKKTGRDFIGVELDEHYFQVAERRIGETS